VRARESIVGVLTFAALIPQPRNGRRSRAEVRRENNADAVIRSERDRYTIFVRPANRESLLLVRAPGNLRYPRRNSRVVFTVRVNEFRVRVAETTIVRAVRRRRVFKVHNNSDVLIRVFRKPRLIHEPLWKLRDLFHTVTVRYAGR